MEIRDNGLADKALSYLKKESKGVVKKVTADAKASVNVALKKQIAPVLQSQGQALLNRAFEVGVSAAIDKLPTSERLAEIVNEVSTKTLNFMYKNVIPKILYTASEVHTLSGNNSAPEDRLLNIYSTVMSKVPDSIEIPQLEIQGLKIPPFKFDMATSIKKALPYTKFKQLFNNTAEVAKASFDINFAKPAAHVVKNAVVTTAASGFLLGSLFTFVLYRVVQGGDVKNRR